VQIFPPIEGILAYPATSKDASGLLVCGKIDPRHKSQKDGEEEVVASWANRGRSTIERYNA
jgi:hypothetical protein